MPAAPPVTMAVCPLNARSIAPILPKVGRPPCDKRALEGFLASAESNRLARSIASSELSAQHQILLDAGHGNRCPEKGQLPALPGEGCLAFICHRGLRGPLPTAAAQAKSSETGRISLRIRVSLALPYPGASRYRSPIRRKRTAGASLNVSKGQVCSAFGLCRTVEELHTSGPKRTMTNQLYYGDNPQVLRNSVPTESVDLACLDQSKQEKLF